MADAQTAEVQKGTFAVKVSVLCLFDTNDVLITAPLMRFGFWPPVNGSTDTCPVCTANDALQPAAGALIYTVSRVSATAVLGISASTAPATSCCCAFSWHALRQLSTC
jgi:hypothetical protein